MLNHSVDMEIDQYTVDTIRIESNHLSFLLARVCTLSPAPGRAFHTKIKEVYIVYQSRLLLLLR